MKYVRKQLELIEELTHDLIDKTKDRSFWQARAIPHRLDDAKSLVKACESLVALVKRVVPDV